MLRANLDMLVLMMPPYMDQADFMQRWVSTKNFCKMEMFRNRLNL